MEHRTCCGNCLPVCAEDGSNEVTCAECGTSFLCERDLGDLRVKATGYDTMMSLFSPNIPQPENPNITFKSLPNIKQVKDMAIWVMESTAKLFRQEVEHAPPELRNRFTLKLFFGEESWNLTLSRGDYEHAVETQRNQARRERDMWMNRFYEAHPNVTRPTNNDNEQDGA